MKSKDEVRARVRGMIAQELDRRIKEAEQRLPRRCVHNHRQPLDERREVMGEANAYFNRIAYDGGEPVDQTLGLCMLNAGDPEGWEGNICEDPIDAKRCPFFEPVQSKQAILEHFKTQLQTGMWLEDNMPDVAALLWVLGDDDTIVREVPWWKRLLYWFVRVRIEPVVKVRDPALLLPASEVEDAGSDGP